MSEGIETEHAFKLPTIFIPTLATEEKAQSMKCENHIGKLCEEIYTCVRIKAQKNLKRLIVDAKSLEQYASKALRTRIYRQDVHLWIVWPNTKGITV